jgi:hypothetical protein
MCGTTYRHHHYSQQPNRDILTPTLSPEAAYMAAPTPALRSPGHTLKRETRPGMLVGGGAILQLTGSGGQVWGDDDLSRLTSALMSFSLRTALRSTLDHEQVLYHPSGNAGVPHVIWDDKGAHARPHAAKVPSTGHRFMPPRPLRSPASPGHIS